MRARAARAQHFGVDVFRDPAWDILLDLYIARLERAEISITSLTIASNAPGTTAIRYIRKLTSKRLIKRIKDPKDGRRSLVAMTNRGFNMMEHWLTVAGERML